MTGLDGQLARGYRAGMGNKFGLLAIAAALAALTACSGSAVASPAACKAAMDRIANQLIANPHAYAGKGQLAAPAACKGLPAAVQKKIATQEVARVERGILRKEFG